MINKYYILSDGEKTGPYTHTELMDLDISGDTQVLSAISNTWETASEMPELTEYFQSKGIYFPTLDNLANFGWRLLAYLIDQVILVVIFQVLGKIIGIPVISDKPFGEPDPTALKIQLATILIAIIYNAVFEATKLQGSIGKSVCRLMVVDVNGERISFLNALGRNLAKILSSLPCGLGYLMMVWDEHSQTWHDKIAKTYIIKRD